MTLPYRQERIARRADHALRHSDPRLASMLSIFTRLAAAEGMPVREQLPAQRRRIRRARLWPASAAASLAAAVGLRPRLHAARPEGAVPGAP